MHGKYLPILWYNELVDYRDYREFVTFSNIVVNEKRNGQVVSEKKRFATIANAILLHRLSNILFRIIDFVQFSIFFFVFSFFSNWRSSHIQLE